MPLKAEVYDSAANAKSRSPRASRLDAGGLPASHDLRERGWVARCVLWRREAGASRRRFLGESYVASGRAAFESQWVPAMLDGRRLVGIYAADAARLL